MFADLASVRSFGTTSAGHAAELATLAAQLTEVPAPDALERFGPVAARFVAALVEATGEASRHASALADLLSHTGSAAAKAADDFDLADHRSGYRLDAAGA